LRFSLIKEEVEVFELEIQKPCEYLHQSDFFKYSLIQNFLILLKLL